MDLEILHSIQQQVGHPILDAVLPLVTMLGQAGMFWIAVGAILLCTRKYRFWGIVLIVALAAVGLLNELIIKNIIARPRPFLADPTIQLLIGEPSGYSFPSGHTGSSFAAATVIACMPIRKGWKVAVWVLAIIIAFSRLYLYVHYPTDVLVGALLGVLYGFIAVKIALALRRRQQQQTSHGKHVARVDAQGDA